MSKFNVQFLMIPLKGRVTFVVAIILFLGPSCEIHAQGDGSKHFLNNRYLMDRLAGMTPTSGSIPGIPMSSPAIRGNTFLKQHFSLATYLLSNDKTTDSYYSKYDPYRNEFYFQSNHVIYLLKGEQVKNFYWIDSLSQQRENYINASQLKNEKGLSFTGFFEILSDGPMPLLRKTEVKVLSPDFNIALNYLYYAEGDIAKVLPTGKKITSLFGKDVDSMVRFIDNNNLDLKNPTHLLELFNYYNRIAGSRITD
jgi:hypothetical protein